MTAQETNNLIREKISNNDIFMYSRLGMGFETMIPFAILTNQPYQQFLQKSHLHSGLYGSRDDIMYYTNLFLESIKGSDIFLEWKGWMSVYEDFLLNNFNKSCIRVEPGTNESFRYETPFTKSFEGKRVLVLSNFIESINKQWLIKDTLFKDNDVLPDFDLVTYKTVSSFLLKSPHSGWRESYELMINDISKLDFDIALVGAGSYSQPICHFVKKEMNKPILNIGGGLPLYFGVMGQRWEGDNELLSKINKQNWIKPLENEKPDNSSLIEGGCYW